MILTVIICASDWLTNPLLLYLPATLDLVVNVLLDLKVAVFDIEGVLGGDFNRLEKLGLETFPLHPIIIIQKDLPAGLVVIQSFERRPRDVLDSLKGLVIGKLHAFGQDLTGLMGLRDQLLVDLDDLLVEITKLRIDR